MFMFSKQTNLDMIIKRYDHGIHAAGLYIPRYETISCPVYNLLVLIVFASTYDVACITVCSYVCHFWELVCDLLPRVESVQVR